MLHHYQLSPALQKVRFNRRCYSLLLHAKINPENLRYFYRTYRLPRDPFFPLYFAVKRNYLDEKEQRKRKKTEYIAAQMRRLPAEVLSFITFLARLEQHCNFGNHYPLWSDSLFPKTKKQVREYHRYTPGDWALFFQSYLTRFTERYRAFPSASAEKITACFLLHCLPELPDPKPKQASLPGGLQLPPAEQILKQFRRASMLHHPDRGGSGEMFVLIQWARDVLLP
jgi:hypothetical protein